MISAADPIKWADQELELQADEQSRRFLRIFTDWFSLAQTLYDETEPTCGETDPKTGKQVEYGARRRRTLAQAVRQAMIDVEDKHGLLSMEWIGQMLLLAREHWVHGQDLMNGLTRLELRMIEQVEAVKLAMLAEAAKGVDPRTYPTTDTTLETPASPAMTG